MTMEQLKSIRLQQKDRGMSKYLTNEQLRNLKLYQKKHDRLQFLWSISIIVIILDILWILLFLDYGITRNMCIYSVIILFISIIISRYTLKNKIKYHKKYMCILNIVKFKQENEINQLQLKEEQRLNSLRQQLMNYILGDNLWYTCTNDNLREIYLCKILFDDKGQCKEPYGELGKQYFYITNQRTLRLTDDGVWFIHTLKTMNS